MNLRATADTRLMMTSYYRNKALRLGLDPYMSIVSGESSMVVL
jgi:hypothetical protein